MNTKYRYFAVSDNSSDYYRTLKEMKNDLDNFGDDEVKCYTLKYVDDIQELTDEDLLFVYKEGKIMKDSEEYTTTLLGNENMGEFYELKDVLKMIDMAEKGVLK